MSLCIEKKEIIIYDLETKLNDLRNIIRGLYSLTSIENNTSEELTGKFNKTTRLVENLLVNRKALLSCKETCHRLSCYQETPVFNTDVLQKIQEDYTALLDIENRYNNLNSASSNLSLLSNIPCILETESVKTLFADLNATYSRLKELKPVQKSLQCFVDIPDRQSLSMDDSNYSNLVSVENGLRDVKSLNARENKIDQDIDKISPCRPMFLDEAYDI